MCCLCEFTFLSSASLVILNSPLAFCSMMSNGSGGGVVGRPSESTHRYTLCAMRVLGTLPWDITHRRSFLKLLINYEKNENDNGVPIMQCMCTHSLPAQLRSG